MTSYRDKLTYGSDTAQTAICQGYFLEENEYNKYLDNDGIHLDLERIREEHNPLQRFLKNVPRFSSVSGHFERDFKYDDFLRHFNRYLESKRKTIDDYDFTIKIHRSTTGKAQPTTDPETFFLTREYFEEKFSFLCSFYGSVNAWVLIVVLKPKDQAGGNYKQLYLEQKRKYYKLRGMLLNR